MQLRGRFIRLVFVLVCVLVACKVMAAESVTLGSRLNAIHSMKANFKQTIYDNHNKPIQQSTGTMAMLRPGKFRWETVKPIPQLIIANSTKLWIVDPDLEQVTIRALHKATGETPALMLSNENAEINKDYVVKELSKKGSSLAWYKLTPKSADSVFESVEMGFKDLALQEMRLEDHLGHNTHIEFTRASLNTSLPESLFVFKKTPNMDVIDETKRK